jgi:septal ring factor EnvC (AmiA/AmiB activator)
MASQGKALFLAIMLLPMLVYADVKQETEKAKQLKLLQQRMALVEKKIKHGQQTKSKEESALRTVEKKLGASAKAIRSLSTRLKRTEQEVTKLQQQQHQLRSDIGKQKELLAEQLRSAYAMGRQQQVKMLLNQQQPERMSRVMQYYDYFNQARIDKVEFIENKVKELDKVEIKLEEENKQLQALVNKKQLENEKLANAKAQRKKVLANIKKEIKSAGSELQQLKENEKRLTALLSSIRQAINDIPILSQENKPFPKLKGKLPWPTKGTLRKSFGSAKSSGRWDGVLIGAREGQPIRSISHGRVVYADWLRGYGLLIIVDHGEGYMSLYAFNQGLYREVGDWVNAGETIASTGLSGGQQSAGLYFSIRKNGKPVNPTRWCRAVKRGRVG